LKKTIIVLSLVFILCFTGILYAQENLKIYFLDVEQGDASVIISPSGKVVMIDSGPDANLILHYLESLIDGVTHWTWQLGDGSLR
jgi:beta-lactamase superfamily II metal-dependent hydrolase